jgi:hypothetical protein
VASPENTEAIIYILSGDTVIFFGRTSECYYMVTGTPGRGTGGGGVSPGKWNADFDTNSDEYDTAHFVVYINERYRSDDDTFVVGGESAVWIELTNDLNGPSQRYFKLSQESLSDDGAVTFSNPDEVYEITPHTPVCVFASGSMEGVVSIKAFETDADGDPPTGAPVLEATAAATVKGGTVAIVPDDGQAGTTGNVVGSNKGATGEKHYVSPKKESDFVILKATGFSGAFDDIYKWDPVPTAGTDVQPVTGSPEKVKVKRDAAKKIVVKVLDKAAPNTQRDRMNVWIVWATPSTPVKGPGPTIIPQKGHVNVKDRHNPQQLGDGRGVQGPTWVFVFTIAPIEMVVGNNDRPDFSGKNATDVPGGEMTHLLFGKKLKEGAITKWDVSRRERVRVLSPTVGSEWFDGMYPGRVYDNLPVANRVQEDYPTDPRIGNDDINAGEKNNTPNANGQIGSVDGPRMPVLRNAAGALGDTVEFRCHYGEFVRLEIAGKWYNVSDFLNWRLHGKLKKASEAVDNVNYNSDGDKTDQLWIDNGSVSDATNLGWE